MSKIIAQIGYFTNNYDEDTENWNALLKNLGQALLELIADSDQMTYTPGKELI